MRGHWVVASFCSLAGVVAVIASLAVGGMPGCVPEVGAIDNEEEVGRQDRGRDPGRYWVEERDEQGNPQDWEYALAYSDIILSPDGLTLLAMVPKPGPDMGFDEPGMVLSVQRLPSGSPHIVSQVQDVRRFNFSPDGTRAYAISKDGREVQVIDLISFKVVQKIQTAAPFSVVDVAPDGQRLVLSNLPTSDSQEMAYGGGHNECEPCWPSLLPEGASLCEFETIHLPSGQGTLATVTWRIRDIDFSSVAGELLVTYSNFIGQDPHAYIEFFSLSTGQSLAKLDFANCADEVVLDPERNLALLAPVDCIKDPISLIDLKTHQFLGNLPGFGPVVISQNHSLAVGFTVKSVLEEEWEYFDQTAEYGLIFVDLDTLEYRIADYGDHAPAYTLSPDGRRLYIYEDSYQWRQDKQGKWYKDYDGAGLAQLDLEDLSWKTLGSNETRLDRFVWTDDASQMYFLSSGSVFRLDVEAETVEPMPLGIAPELLNLRPQQDYLLLGESDQPIFYLVDRTNSSLVKTLNLAIP